MMASFTAHYTLHITPCTLRNAHYTAHCTLLEQCTMDGFQEIFVRSPIKLRCFGLRSLHLCSPSRRAPQNSLLSRVAFRNDARGHRDTHTVRKLRDLSPVAPFCATQPCGLLQAVSLPPGQPPPPAGPASSLASPLHLAPLPTSSLRAPLFNMPGLAQRASF